MRGFRENQLVRDAGVIYNLEFEYPLVKRPGKGLQATIIPFYDYGRGWNKSDSSTTISSWGLSNRIRWQDFSLDLVLAKRLESPRFARALKSTLQDKGVHVQLSYAFF